ncbi:hypothetical protein CEXT_156971 [Caerostris extrusa]|uniref:Uncharacterized protein n=1 Tax=Caerostris extrusa TaxID=172846 RepID=A0AAV4P1U6_CAEEX|nr:hypothetical protein CEXT_156971 [Caerostris extrusa]
MESQCLPRAGSKKQGKEIKGGRRGGRNELQKWAQEGFPWYPRKVLQSVLLQRIFSGEKVGQRDQGGAEMSCKESKMDFLCCNYSRNVKLSKLQLSGRYSKNEHDKIVGEYLS